MKIGIDIDGVILDFASKFLEYYNKKHKKNISIEDWITYNFWDLVSMSEEEGKKFEEGKRIIDEKICNIKSKYSTLFKGIYTDDYDYSPFTDFLLVLIRFLEQNNWRSKNR